MHCYGFSLFFVWPSSLLLPIHPCICFCAEDGRSGTFVIGNEHFPASLLDLPCVVESYKTYDDCALVKTADIGQVRVLIKRFLVSYCLTAWILFLNDISIIIGRWSWLEKQVTLLQTQWNTDMDSLLLWGMLENEDFVGSQTSMYKVASFLFWALLLNQIHIFF